jgi:phytoene dehydrogenase-like protein
MNPLDIAVIGSGIGGSLISALNQDKNLTLFEKEPNLGGCASTFKRRGNFYNAGATTFVGYEESHPIKEMFDKVNFIPDITKSEIAIRVIQNDKIIDRVKDFETFIDNINSIYPHINNRIFWSTIKSLDEKFWELKKLYYAKYNINAYLKTANAILELISVFKFDVLKSANSYINETLFGITDSYKSFIDAQLLITIQTTSKDISLLSLAVGLAYPFHDVFYVNNGMGSLFDGLLKNVDIHKNEEIHKIYKEKEYYKIVSSKNEYLAKQIILNSSIYNTSNLFDDKNIQKYYDSFSFSDQSAFVLYLTLDSKESFLHHYQIILDKQIPHSISNSFFISFSSKDDNKLSKNGYSITISTHTKASIWKDISKEEYEKQKQTTQDFIINQFLHTFKSVEANEIVQIHSGTAQTFNKYINRYNCGGKAITIKNIFQTPSCTTPFDGLYNVGDTVFAGQGWPGVALGVNVLNKEING